MGEFTIEERRRSHDDLPERMRALAADERVGGCTCGTEVDEWKFHNVGCRWRILTQGAARIESLMAAPKDSAPLSRFGRDLEV